MNCDCKTRIETLMAERFKEKHPEAVAHVADLIGYALATQEDSMVQVGYMTVELTANFPLKKGGQKLKRVRWSMHFSYCPFCGVKA